MTYHIVYEPEYQRIMTACIIDARASIPAIKNQVGTVIKDYVDTQLSYINTNAICYKLETDLGVLAGYFVIQVTPASETAMIDSKVLRPAFVQFDSDISTQISNFIQLNNWKPDYLF